MPGMSTMNNRRLQFSLSILFLLVLVVAAFAWSIHERRARKYAEAQTEIAIEKAAVTQKLLDRVSLASDDESTFLLDVHRGSIIAVSRSEGQMLWESSQRLQRNPNVFSLSASLTEGGKLSLEDADGNWLIVLDSRTGQLLELHN